MTILLLALRRLAASLPTLLLILAGLFLLLQLAPGDTVDALMAQMGGGDPATASELRRYYGLDVSALVQLGRYFLRLVQLDLGMSAIYGKPVAAVIAERLPVTLLLMGTSLSLAFAGGTALGIVAARRLDRWPDTLISTLGLIFYATPSFWFGLMGIVLFAITLGWLPAGGFEEVGSGLGETAIVIRHALRNALLPMVTLVGLQAGTMLGGSVVVESVFALPGLGRLAYESVVQRDLNTLLGIVFVSALLVIAVNFAVDLLYGRLDPRITAGR
jgi:peptide/nickel transport system permease protein